MKQRPRIGVWNPAEPGSDSIPEVDAQVAELAEWIPLDPERLGLAVTTTAEPSTDRSCLQWTTATGGPLPCHGLVVPDRDSADDPAETASAGRPQPATETAPDLESTLLQFIPVIRGELLSDGAECEVFFERASGAERIERLFGSDWRVADLVAFNARERFRTIVHDPKKHALMGRIVAKAKDHPRDDLVRNFTQLYLSALAKPVTRRKHQSLFTHVQDLLGDRLDTGQHENLRSVIQSYRDEEVDRAAPMEVLREHIVTLGVRGLETQSYLFPEPLEVACLGLMKTPD